MIAPHLSPTAGLFNALLRLAINRLTARATELRQLIAAETERGHQLRTAAGYIDRTELEGP